ncbi:hypothetical protein GQ600_19844 [Phytophthora cactorum]|nr:hypothetical protein GQ600_19844 [Phytophthora cactorum]
MEKQRCVSRVLQSSSCDVQIGINWTSALRNTKSGHPSFSEHEQLPRHQTRIQTSRRGQMERFRAHSTRALPVLQKVGTECPATITAAVAFNPDPSAQAYQVKVTSCKTVHNHAVKKRVFRNYASNHKVTDEAVVGVVYELRLTGSNPKLILSYLHKTTGTRR